MTQARTVIAPDTDWYDVLMDAIDQQLGAESFTLEEMAQAFEKAGVSPAAAHDAAVALAKVAYILRPLRVGRELD